MQLHLVLPGLLWPGKALRDTASDLDLPALAWLLGRGRHHWQGPEPLENWLCHAFGIERPHAPAAALRMLGEGREPGAAHWLCADPAGLRIEQGRLSLDIGHAHSTGISANEMGQLAAALAPQLAEVGEFHAGAPGHGYLKLHRQAEIATLPPSAAAGSSSPLPSGKDAALWRRLGNEAQMLLHTLPLNAQRETEGRSPLNTLWFWGAGQLPPRPAAAACAYQAACGQHPLLNGLAAWSGIARHANPSLPDLLARHPGQELPSLLLLDTLHSAARQLDALAWRAALADIERDWLQPLRQHLRAGHIKNLRLTALGDEARLDVRLTRADPLKFWRRPQALHALSYAQAAAAAAPDPSTTSGGSARRVTA